MTELSKMTRAAYERLKRANDLANDMQGDTKLHRLAMATVFVLEDTAFALHQAAAAEVEERQKISIAGRSPFV